MFRDSRSAVDCLSKLISHCVLCFPNPVGNTCAPPPSLKKKRKKKKRPGPTCRPAVQHAHTEMIRFYSESADALAVGKVLRRHVESTMWMLTLAVRCGELMPGNVRWSVVHAGGKISVFPPRTERETKRPFAEGREERGKKGWRRGVSSTWPASPYVACRNLHTSYFLCLLFKSLRYAKVTNAFNGYTIYYHATTTRGHPGTCAPLQNTQEETSKIQQLQAGTRVWFGSKRASRGSDQVRLMGIMAKKDEIIWVLPLHIRVHVNA